MGNAGDAHTSCFRTTVESVTSITLGEATELVGTRATAVSEPRQHARRRSEPRYNVEVPESDRFPDPRPPGGHLDPQLNKATIA